MTGVWGAPYLARSELIVRLVMFMTIGLSDPCCMYRA